MLPWLVYYSSIYQPISIHACVKLAITLGRAVPSTAVLLLIQHYEREGARFFFNTGQYV